MLGFQIGDEQRHRTEAFGEPVDLHSYRQPPEAVARMLREAGFEPRTTVVTEPAAGEAPAHAHLFACKPAA